MSRSRLRSCRRSYITATSKFVHTSAQFNRQDNGQRSHYPLLLAGDGREDGVASPPSTMTVSTSPAPLRRNAAASSYSGEVKQATASSKLGNSITTKRWNLSGPSM